MPKVTYNQFVELLSLDMKTTKKMADKWVTAVVNRIFTEALRGNTVVINGFGTFTTCNSRGYTVNLPASIAQVVPRVREAHKEGDIVPVYGTMVTTQEEIDKHNKQPDRETDMYFGEDGIIYAKFIKDTIEYNYPYFRRLRSTNRKCLAERKKQNAKSYV